MQPNQIKRRMRAGQLALSAMSSLSDAAVAEIVARAGFDGLIIEMEHAPIDLAKVRELILACELAGIASQVRIPAGEWVTVQQLLDYGLQGVQVAHVRTQLDAREATEAVRYPPLGNRGALGTSRAAGYGDVNWQDHVQTSNAEIVLNLMIEDVDGLRNLEEIASTDGVDIVTIGPHDLSQSLGLAAEPGNPKLRRAVDDAGQRLRVLGKAGLGLAIGHPLLPLTMDEIKGLGVVHSNVLPPIERRLLTTLTGVVEHLREEASSR